MRKSTIFLLFTAGELLLGGAWATHGLLARRGAEGRLVRSFEVVRRFQLTDLNLFNEARYTRHLSQADLHTPFQDHPGALEHFPSGAVAGPPAGVQRGSEAPAGAGRRGR